MYAYTVKGRYQLCSLNTYAEIYLEVQGKKENERKRQIFNL